MYVNEERVDAVFNLQELGRLAEIPRCFCSGNPFSSDNPIVNGTTAQPGSVINDARGVVPTDVT